MIVPIYWCHNRESHDAKCKDACEWWTMTDVEVSDWLKVLSKQLSGGILVKPQQSLAKLPSLSAGNLIQYLQNKDTDHLQVFYIKITEQQSTSPMLCNL
jgi:hypothetical protein